MNILNSIKFMRDMKEYFERVSNISNEESTTQAADQNVKNCQKVIVNLVSFYRSNRT